MDTNSLALVALARQYCAEIDNTVQNTVEREALLKMCVRLLPRLYIALSDLPDKEWDTAGYISNVIEEDEYNAVRSRLQSILGEDDTYLEVFEEDMKYSETPIAASISEGLADIYQSMYNFTETVREAPEEVISEALEAVKDEFRTFLSGAICNVMRPINMLYNS